MTLALFALLRVSNWITDLPVRAFDVLLRSVPTPSYILLGQAGALGELKAKLETVLTIIMLFGFLYGTIRIIGGASQVKRGDVEEGKASIISGALIAAAPLIMRILFEIFFNSRGSVFAP